MYIFLFSQSQECEFSVRVSFLELYNEELFDLLGSSIDPLRLKIYEDSSRKVMITFLFFITFQFIHQHCCVFEDFLAYTYESRPQHTSCQCYREYQMSVGLILNLLNKLNKCILCESLTSIMSFYSTSSINLVMYQHEFNILFITYSQKELLIVKKDHFSPTRQ